MACVGLSAVPMYYLGELSRINLQSGERDKDVQLIDQIEEAQLDNRMPIYPKQSDLVYFNVSTHGFNITQVSSGIVIHRHPLHNIAQIVFYTEANEKNNLVFKIGRDGDLTFDCLVFQCQDEEVAVRVCETFKSLFDMFLNIGDDD